MSPAATRRAAVEAFLPRSPFAAHLGLELVALEPDRAVLRLPFRPEHATLADVVHGGALATLVDTAGMVAAWADEGTPAPAHAAGATVSLAVSYVAAARGAPVDADARVVRRGGSLCFVDVRATCAGAVVATGAVVHRFG